MSSFSIHRAALAEIRDAAEWYRERSQVAATNAAPGLRSPHGPDAPAPPSAPPRDPDVEGPDSDGVDVTLIRWMLSLTPDQRLDVLQGFVDSVAEFKRAARDA